MLMFGICVPSVKAVKYQAIPYNPKYDQKLLHFGFLLGVNTMNFTLKTDELGRVGDSLYGIQHKMHPGFSVGVITSIRMGKYFDFRFIPTFSLGQRDLEYTIKRPEDIEMSTKKKAIESIMVELPIEFKWKAKRMVNSRPYIVGGFKYTADLASLTKKEKVDEEEDDYEIKLNKHDVGFTLGVGWEFYLPYNNKIALEVKMFFGMLDLLQREDNIYTNRIEKLTSKMFQINITFE